ncbi:MAG: glycoside hydrolase family protein [Mesorhizobium sp.]
MPNVPAGAATAAARKTSPAGRSAITQREGCVLTAYTDSAGVLTIGVGHTSAAGAPKVSKGMKITAAQADEILSRDLAAVEATVSRSVKVPLNQNEFDALVSLVFNIGGGAFKGSTLLRKLNAGDRAGAANQFTAWNKATVKGKKVALPGLTVRREAERRQFLRPDTSQPAQEAPKPVPAPSEPPKAQPAPTPAPVAKRSLLQIIIDALKAIVAAISRRK